ncbi:phospholipase A [Sphingobium sp. CR28]|uniref:phospholipase A n=1 Tax=Sphingobium sp. CR28 TaxID=3400272 RepID=UPI003FEFCF39
MQRSVYIRAAFAACLFAPASYGAEAPNYVISRVQIVDGRPAIDLLILNETDLALTVSLPATVQAQVSGETVETSPLERDNSDQSSNIVEIAAHTFSRARYRATSPVDAKSGQLISVPAFQTQRVALTTDVVPDSEVLSAEATAGSTRKSRALALSGQEIDRSPQSFNERAKNSFTRNFSTYEPSYIVFGNAKDSEWRVQASFKYRLIGSEPAPTDQHTWHDGLYFAFTQKMFWDIASDASFRDVNYLPEIFYRTPAVGMARKVAFSLQMGIQHESNGRAGDLGRSLNNIYISPASRFDLGDGYALTVAPRVMNLIGGRSGNPDILDYRGNTSINIQIGKDNGLRFATDTRYNFAAERGSFQGELSYPLPNIIHGAPDLYLFGQIFSGYGESLRDYDRRMTRLRFGIALTR